eukprot:gene12844-biopygen8855
MTALASLALSTNQLSGTLPQALGQMTALTNLDLYNNQLSGFIPDHLFLHTYNALYLSDNDWTCPLPENAWSDKGDTSCTDPDPTAPLIQLYNSTQ